jgi:signal transduction histidine kinase
MSKESRESRLIVVSVIVLFAALAGLSASLIAGESRRARILTEYEADRIASVLGETARARRVGKVEGLDERIIGFGLYKPDGSLVAGFGELPPALSGVEARPSFDYDQGKRRLALTRPLGGGGPGGPFLRAMRQRMLGMSPGMQGMAPPLDRGMGQGSGFVYLLLDIAGYYRRRALLSAAAVLVPLIVTALAALFLRLLAANTRYRRAARERETLARLGESARTLAHEIRNPLGAIRIQAGLMRQRLPGGDWPELGAIEEETDRLSALSRRVGDFLKNPRGDPEAIELGPFLEELARRSPQAPRFVDGRPPERAAQRLRVAMDPALLRSAVENLLRNAAESYDEAAGGEVELELSAPSSGGRVAIVVRDRGRGIPEAELEKVFDPFYTDKIQGQGIGLPLARRIVEAAGGSLELANRPVGGLEARIRLPVAKAAGGRA